MPQLVRVNNYIQKMVEKIVEVPIIIEQIRDEKDFPKLAGMIICEKPNNLLYKFEGQLTLGSGKTISLNADNLMLRGCQLRNTDYVYGITVFQGPDTKIMRNSAKPKYKFS